MNYRVHITEPSSDVASRHRSPSDRFVVGCALSKLIGVASSIRETSGDVELKVGLKYSNR